MFNEFNLKEVIMYNEEELEKTGESFDYENAPKSKEEAERLGYSTDEEDELCLIKILERN